MERDRTLASIPDEELLRGLSALLRESRHAESDLVAHIGEVDARGLYAREACSSMFAYCTERLHLSEAEAYLRITAARAARVHPVLLAMLADGRLHLSAMAKLVPHLTRDNADVLLQRAAYRSKRQIEELIAEIAPRPDAPAVMRRMPGAPARIRQLPGAPAGIRQLPDGPTMSCSLPDGSSPAPAVAAPRLPGHVLTPPPFAPEASSKREPTSSRCELRPDGVGAPASLAVPVVIETLAPGRYKVQFTASATLHDKLRRLQELWWPRLSQADLATIIEEAITEKLARLEARRFARTKRPSKGLRETETKPTSRHVPSAVKRAVHERDGGRCRYTDDRGRRCSERSGLEFHHRYPFGRGGDHSPPNLSLLCRAHNAFLAEHDYGREVMSQHPGSG